MKEDYDLIKKYSWYLAQKEKLLRAQTEERDNLEKRQREEREKLKKEYGGIFNFLYEFLLKEEITDRNPQENEKNENKIIPLNEALDNQKAEKKRIKNKNKKIILKKKKKALIPKI